MTARFRLNIKLTVFCAGFVCALLYGVFGLVTGFAPPFETFYVQTNGYRWSMPFDLLSLQRIVFSIAMMVLFIAVLVSRKNRATQTKQTCGMARHHPVARYGFQWLLLTAVLWVGFHQSMLQYNFDWFWIVSAILTAGAVVWGLTRPWSMRIYEAASRIPVLPVMVPAAAAVLLLGFFEVHYGQAIITDAQSQIAQARLMLTGKMKIELPDQLFQVAQIPNFLTTNPTYAQYPPGHILLLIPFIAAGLPANILNMICGVGAVFFTIKLCRSIAGKTASVYTAILLITSPLFIGMESSAMNHGSTALMLITTAWAFHQVIWRGRTNLLWVGVFALGWAGITRPLTGLCHAAVWAPLLAMHFYRTVQRMRHDKLKSGPASSVHFWKPWIIATFVSMAPIGILAVYNWQTTGNPLLMGYMANNPEMHRLGFHADGPYPYTPAEAVHFIVCDMLSLSRNMFGWPMSSWVLMLGWLLLSRLTTGELAVAALILAQSIAYRYYHFYDLLIGPRFVSELVPFYAVLGGIGVTHLTRHLNRNWRPLPQVVIIILTVTALISAISLWSNKLSAFTSKHVMVERFINENPVRDRPRVILVPWNFAETAGEYTFGGKYPTWFVLDNSIDQARQVPELQNADWFHLINDSKSVFSR